MEHRFQHSSIDSGRQMERYSWSMPAAAANSLQRTPAMTCSHHVHASQEVAVRAYAHLAYWKWHSWDRCASNLGNNACTLVYITRLLVSRFVLHAAQSLQHAVRLPHLYPILSSSSSPMMMSNVAPCFSHALHSLGSSPKVSRQ